MELILENSAYTELSTDVLTNIEAGGLALGIVSGVGTVCAAVAVAVCAPPGTKIGATAKVVFEGALLTAGAYYL